MDKHELDKTFNHYMEIFKGDKELGKIMSRITFKSCSILLFCKRTANLLLWMILFGVVVFGIMNLLEVENVNQDNWNAYIAKNSECETWHEFGKLAMIDWMKNKLEEVKKSKN